MKSIFSFILLFYCSALLAQNVSVDKDLYGAQELIEQVLINSGCIENIEVTNAVSADFPDGDSSYGYFENNGGDFPFEKGIVMTTGKLSHVPGPNNMLSDDNAPGWGGDEDLENYLNTGQTVNATILEFDFTPNANNIQFRYIFASEEYRENQSSTCQYSDAFAFLIRPTGQSDYENIALVPGTDTPVKVTTVHSGIPGSCPPQNEEYFAGYNGPDSPIVFNGQTEVLTAEAQVDPGQAYHIKLVIADEQNYRYDSAVFLEGESFNIGADLGGNVTGLCEDDTYTLQPEGNGNAPDNYQWYEIEENGNEILLAEGPNEEILEINQSGTYKVVLEYGGSCVAEDTITVSYTDFSSISPTTITSCLPSDNFPNGFKYDLDSFDSLFTQGNEDWDVAGYYLTEEEAEENENPITDSENFESQAPDQEIYVRIETDAGCYTTTKVTLAKSDAVFYPVAIYTCPDETDPSLYHFNLNEAIPIIQEILNTYIDGLTYYESEEDAFYGENPLPVDYEIMASDLPHSVYTKIQSNSGCEGLFEIQLTGLSPASLDPNYTPQAFCLDAPADSVLIHAGVNGNENNYEYEWETGETTPTIQVNSPGDYEVNISAPHLIESDTTWCTLTRVITVTESEKPTVSYKLHGEPGNYELEIIAEGLGTYWYALDQENGFQPHNRFPVEAGEHVFYVTDRNGCGTVKRTFHVLDYMKFFTPNGDGINDYWRIIGDDPKNPQVKNIEIYDRYGKLITVLGPLDEWDGNFHGKALPGNDYWFKINFKNGNSFKGHFSLLR